MAKQQTTSFKDLIQSETPVLIDFHATWCGPCQAFAPVLDQLKQEVGDAVRIVKIDIDRNQELSSKLGVRGVPTVMIFKGGELQWRASGMQTIPVLKQQLGIGA